ncbi:MAG: hypothetical protein JWM27_3953 [Gemmatimonadetes bacterium]|nr:hypothetical protein [Gemmatimonadota bacterium]
MRAIRVAPALAVVMLLLAACSDRGGITDPLEGGKSSPAHPSGREIPDVLLNGGTMGGGYNIGTMGSGHEMPIGGIESGLDSTPTGNDPLNPCVPADVGPFTGSGYNYCAP